MTVFAAKIHQQQVLDSVAAYFNACHELPSASIAFTATTERPWGRGNAIPPAVGLSHRHAVLRSVRAHRRREVLAVGEECCTGQHQPAALRARRERHHP